MTLVIPVDLGTAAVERLKAFPPYQNLVIEGLIGTDAETNSDAEKLLKAWLFQGLDDEGRPFRDPEGSGWSAVVLTARTDWTGANPHNTAKFPVLQMLLYVDSTRDEDGGVQTLDATRKAKFLAAELDKCFHLVGNSSGNLDHDWPGGFDVHNCIRASGIEIRDVPGTQSATVRVEMRYNLIAD